ncbi:MAG: polysaccharide deacetylase family protein [Bacteroidota bacterium]|nr:polysaccharide deacetylase family protein [Bacteroidota bacterium]
MKLISPKKHVIVCLFISSLMISFACNENKTNRKLTSVAAIIPEITSPTLKDSLAINSQPIASSPIQYDTTKKYIYLTFDDGPQHGTTACVETIKKEQIKATFFMIGNQVNDVFLKKLVTSIRNDYPQILLANHSYTHANNKYVYFYHHPNMAFNDFMEAQETMHVPFKIIRLPGNSAWINAVSMKASPLVKPVCSMLDSVGYNVIGWDVEWSFNHKNANPIQTPETMLQLVNNAFEKNYTHTKNHLVILTHDRMFRNANFTDSLQKFIGLLKQNPNYVFETVDHYPNLKKPL